MQDKPASILVAEDNPALAAVICFNLRHVGLDVTSARNGREAWEIAKDREFDLIVTDHQMPEMTGVDLCGKLREASQYASTPIVMLTAKGLELDLADLKSTLGISEALPKPFSPAELVKSVLDSLASAPAAAPA